MKLHKLVKQNGKRCLYNNWGKAIAIILLEISVCLLFTLVELMINMVFGTPQIVDPAADGFFLNNLPNTSLLSMALTLIMTLGSFLIMAPLELGITGWYYGLSEGESPEILSIFNCFSNRNYFRALSLQIHMWGRKLILALFYFLIPAAVAVASVLCLEYGPQYMQMDMVFVIGYMGLLFAALLGLLFGICYAIHIQKFFLARYYLVNEGLGVWEALKKARHASKGKRGEIFVFRISFLPWWLSCFFVIPCMYVMPYYETSAMLYARVLMEQHERSTKLVPVDSSSDDMDNTLIFDMPKND